MSVDSSEFIGSRQTREGTCAHGLRVDAAVKPPIPAVVTTSNRHCAVFRWSSDAPAVVPLFREVPRQRAPLHMVRAVDQSSSGSSVADFLACRVRAASCLLPSGSISVMRAA